MFNFSPDQIVYFIKRVIGLPGDRVQMKDGILWLNGQEVPQTPAGTFTEENAPQGPQQSLPKCANEPVIQGGPCEKARYTEALPGGPSHDVLNIFDNGPRYNTAEFTAPVCSYFFMVDNRDNSGDSRWPAATGGVGMVPAEYLIGRADRIMFSSAGKSLLYFWTWRGDRFFKAVE